MIVIRYAESQPFTTKDGSTIRSLLDKSNAPVLNQSLAEALIHPGKATTRHRHPKSEEFYYLIEGRGRMEVDGEERQVGAGDAIQIAPGQIHQIFNIGTGPLRILCACAPAYSHEDTELLD